VFDFIVDNFYVLIIAAVFIGGRILAARKKQQEADRPVQIVEEDEPPPPAPVKKKKPKAAVPKAVIPEAAASIALTEHIADSQRPRPYQAEFSEKPFPENLDYLPPLQRALALSEILGPPKGLD
jgi:hypothetical protein